MWLAERDACSEVRATIRMSRSSLYTAARRRPEGIPPRREVIGCAVRRRGGAPGRPLHRSAPPGSARSRSRAESYVCVRRVCAVGVRPLVAPSLGIRANSGLSSGRCRARAPRGRVADTYTGCTLVDATDGTRAMDAWRAWAPQRRTCWLRWPRRLAGGTAAYPNLSPIPDSGYRKKKIHTQPHCASRRTTLFSPPVGMMSRVRRQPPPDAPRLVPRAQMSIASSLSHLEPNRTSLASTVTPGVLFSFLRNKRLASSLSP